MNIGGCVPARIPPDYAWKVVDNFEPEGLLVLKKWMESVQNPVLVDVGCSYGFISCAGLFSNTSSRVIAIDSDRHSLKVAQKLCACAPQVNERLSFVWGFVSDEPTDQIDYYAAHRVALRELNQPDMSGRPELIHYVCLDTTDVTEKAIARHTLDNLIPTTALPGAPILIKCDVEGAELLVLKGARRLLAERHPALLLSVHPPQLPKYGTTKDDLRAVLSGYGYTIDVIAVDHEEHWWCVKSGVQANPSLQK